MLSQSGDSDQSMSRRSPLKNYGSVSQWGVFQRRHVIFIELLMCACVNPWQAAHDISIAIKVFIATRHCRIITLLRTFSAAVHSFPAALPHWRHCRIPVVSPSFSFCLYHSNFVFKRCFAGAILSSVDRWNAAVDGW